MDQDDFEDAIIKQVVAESGLPAGKVVWSKQGRGRPARPFIAVDYVEDTSNQFSEQRIEENPDWDGETDTLNVDALLVSNIDHIDAAVQLMAYSVEPGDAVTILKRVRIKLASDRATEALGDIALVHRGNVRDVSDVLENEYEGRAILAVTFRVADVNVEEAGVIEKVETETTLTLPDGTTVETDQTLE